MSEWKSRNRHKYLLQYHIIFVCKYRKKLLSNKYISDNIKQLSIDISAKYDFIIKEMETDKDHIHYLIESSPNVSVSQIVRVLKQQTTYNIWKLYAKNLSKHFWNERTFWTDGYFVCSIGNVSQATLKKYIENQG